MYKYKKNNEVRGSRNKLNNTLTLTQKIPSTFQTSGPYFNCRATVAQVAL